MGRQGGRVACALEMGGHFTGIENAGESCGLHHLSPPSPPCQGGDKERGSAERY